MSLTVILPKNEYSAGLRSTVEPLLPNGCTWWDPDEDGLEGLQGKRILFAVALDESGCNMSFYRMLALLRKNGSLLEGCLGGVIITGVGDLYTKDVARDLVLAANLSGCAFIGRPLVEATGSLRNFSLQAKINHVDEKEAFRLAVEDLAQRLVQGQGLFPVRNILVLHSSVRATSNTLALWELVKENLPEEAEVTELCLRNGTLADCVGCSYTTCLHYGEQGRCFYGGPIVEEVFPAVRACDALVMLCANYNDTLAANLTAFINRLTALYRQSGFQEKRLYGLIVSGYSGGDIVARQLISALNMNKNFYLPPRFCMMVTANEKGSLIKLPGIEQLARDFSHHLMERYDGNN